MRLPVSMIKGVDLFNSVLLDGLGDFRTVHIDTVWQGQDYRRKLCWVAIRRAACGNEMRKMPGAEKTGSDEIHCKPPELSCLLR